MRILIIEDDKRLANLMRKVLEAEKFCVDVAHDGDLGLEIARREAHDVLVVDWMLPGRDGPSICQAVRSARIPVAILMLTARTQVEDRVAGLYSGADDYLGKPFSFDELIARYENQPEGEPYPRAPRVLAEKVKGNILKSREQQEQKAASSKP